MRATQRSLLVLLFVFICNMALLAPTLRAAPKGKEFVNKKAGFRLQIPAGWRESAKLLRLKKLGVLAAFENTDQKLAVVIRRPAFSGMIAGEDPFVLSRDFRGISNYAEAKTVLSGLPAGKVMFSSRNQARRIWVLSVSAGLELWLLEVSGPDKVLRSPDNPRYQEVQQLIDSFEFLEPVLTRLKAGG